jgi:hypothetical protein
MSRILKRPMFRRGGSSNQGIMTGLVDRTKHADQPFVTGIGKTAEALTPELEALLRQYTPKTRLPIGEFGLNIASGMSLTDALSDPYKRFTRADDAREAAIRGGAAKLAIGKALEKTKDTRHPLEKLAVSMGLKVGSPEYNQFIRDATAKTEAAAAANRAMQETGQVVGGPARDKIVNSTKFVERQLGNLNEIQKIFEEDPSLGGLTGSLRRFGNKTITAAKDLNIDLTGPIEAFGGEELLLDTNIAKINALEDLLVPAYARVMNPNTRITNLMLIEAKKAIKLTGLTGSDEVKARLAEIQNQFKTYIKDQNTLLGNQPVLKKDLDNWFYDTKSKKLKLRGQQ